MRRRTDNVRRLTPTELRRNLRAKSPIRMAAAPPGNYHTPNISVTTTAMLRPKLLDQTYASFQKNLIGLDFKQTSLFLNIDPLPVGGDPNAVVKVAQKYFGNVVYHIATEPNFAKAVKWCWNAADTDYVFHIEDDWLLTETVPIKHLLAKLERPNIFQVVLRAFPEQYGLALVCHLSKRYFYKTFARKLRDDVNPEVQMRLEEPRGLHTGQQWRPLEWLPDEIPIRQNNADWTGKVVLRDLGREWIRGTNCVRPNPHFNTWKVK